MVVLMNPLSVTLEVDLGGGRGSTGQRHRLVLYDVDVVRFHQEVRQQVRERGGERVRHRGGVLRSCDRQTGRNNEDLGFGIIMTG